MSLLRKIFVCSQSSPDERGSEATNSSKNPDTRPKKKTKKKVDETDETCSETEEDSDKETECAVCQDNLTEPCTIPCGNQHVFCLSCLKGLITHNTYRTHFPCPLCRKRVRIPFGGVTAFRNNKTLGQKLRSKFPALRPRSRRRSRSSSSGRSSDLLTMSIPVFGYNDDLELDILSTLYPQRERQPMNRAQLVEAILEEIHQELWPSSPPSRQNALWLSEDLDASDSDQDDERDENMNRRASDAVVAGSDRLTSEDILRSVDPEELDMTVVLQIIADMEENDRRQEANQSTSQRSASSSAPPRRSASAKTSSQASVNSRGTSPMSESSGTTSHRSDSSSRPTTPRISENTSTSSSQRLEENPRGAAVTPSPSPSPSPRLEAASQTAVSNIPKQHCRPNNESDAAATNRSPVPWSGSSPRFPRPRMGSFRMAIAAGQINQAQYEEDSPRLSSSTELQCQASAASSVADRKNPSTSAPRNRNSENAGGNTQRSRTGVQNSQRLDLDPDLNAISAELDEEERGFVEGLLEMMDILDKISNSKTKQSTANAARDSESRDSFDRSRRAESAPNERRGEDAERAQRVNASSPSHTPAMISERSRPEQWSVQDLRTRDGTRMRQTTEDASSGELKTLSDGPEPEQRRLQDRPKPRRATTALTDLQKVVTKARRATTSGYDFQDRSLSTMTQASNTSVDDLDRSPRTVTQASTTSVIDLDRSRNTMTPASHTSVKDLDRSPRTVTQASTASVIDLDRSRNTMTPASHTSVKDLDRSPRTMTQASNTSVNDLDRSRNTMTQASTTSVKDLDRSPRTMTQASNTSVNDLDRSRNTMTQASTTSVSDLDSPEEWTRRIRDLQRRVIARTSSRPVSGDAGGSGGDASYHLGDAYSLTEGGSLRDGHSLGDTHSHRGAQISRDGRRFKDARSSKDAHQSGNVRSPRDARNSRDSHRLSTTTTADSHSLDRDGHSLGNCHSLILDAHSLGALRTPPVTSADLPLQPSIDARTTPPPPIPGDGALVMDPQKKKKDMDAIHV